MHREQHTFREFVELWLSCAWPESSFLYSRLHASYGLFCVSTRLCRPNERREMESNKWNRIVVQVLRDIDPKTLRIATAIDETLL
jgi:hypothetical protein